MKQIYNEILKRSCRILTPQNFMSDPFTVGNYSMATDGLMMVFVDNELTDEYPSLTTINPTSITRTIPTENLNITIPVDKLKNALDKFTKEEIIQTDKIECGECEGSGEVPWTYKHYEVEDDCPKCQGSGNSFVRSKSTGLFKYINGQYVKLFVSHLNPNHVQYIIEFAELLKQDRIILTSQESYNKPVMFKIGQLNCLFMPVILNETGTVTEIEITEEV